MGRHHIKLQNSASKILKLHTVSLSESETLLEHVPIIFFRISLILSLFRRHTHIALDGISSSKARRTEAKDVKWTNKSCIKLHACSTEPYT